MPSSTTDEALYRCALYYGKADSDREFKIARSVLAECLIRMFIDAVVRCPIRIIGGFETDEWLRVADAAIAICKARMWPEDEDVTIPIGRLKSAGKKWATIAKWTPEPWRK